MEKPEHSRLRQAFIAWKMHFDRHGRYSDTFDAFVLYAEEEYVEHLWNQQEKKGNKGNLFSEDSFVQAF